MKCDTKECDREATVHLTEIVNGNISKLHLCEDHAKQKGVEMEQHFGIADLLQGLAEYGAPPVQSVSKKSKCSNCGMGYDDFKKIGRLGCGDCYLTFRDSLAPLLKRIHGSNQHIGKNLSKGVRILAKETTSSRSITRSRSTAAKPLGGTDISALREKLRKVISDEMYEEAAKIRDQIRALESKEKRGSRE